MTAAHSPKDRPARPEPQPPGTPLRHDELLRLYEAEREARIAAEKRLEAALAERSTASATAAVRDYVMAGAHCLLWYADVHESDAQYLHWIMEFPNADAARRFLPIEIRENETIKDAWYWRRHPEDRAACDRIGTDAVRAGQSYQQEFRCFCEDGSVRWLHEDVCVETVVEGRQWRAVGVCTDITSHYQVKERMQATNRRLKRSIAETHHRVKNNLQVVAALVDMQRQEAGQPAEAQSAFERMGQHIRSLAAMHDLLTYEARSGSEHESISARAVLEKLVGLVRQTVGDRKIVARVEDVRLASRQMASLVVLVNELLSNAMKHGQGSVTLSLERRGALVRLEVCDQGPGFPARFDPLATGRTGLEIVESIGRMDLQGTLEYGTRPGGGGRVTLEFLPADPVPA